MASKLILVCLPYPYPEVKSGQCGHLTDPGLPLVFYGLLNLGDVIFYDIIDPTVLALLYDN